MENDENPVKWLKAACEIAAKDLTKHLEGQPAPMCEVCGAYAAHVTVNRVDEDGRVHGPFRYFCDVHKSS